jgi:WG containing repeat
VITPRFATYPNGYVHPFSDGLAMIEVRDLFGYIDRSGAFAITPQFLDGRSFVDGMARVVVEGPCVYFPEGGCGFANPVFPGVKKGNDSRSGSYPPCKFAYIDKTGRMITSRRFDSARDFSEGVAPVRIGDAWGFIDKTGAVAIAPKFENVERFSSGLSKVLVNGSYGFIGRIGAIAIPPQFKEAESFSEGFAVVGDGNGRYWYIDQLGQQGFPGEFAVASPFFKGLAHVRLLRQQLTTSRYW